MPWQSLCSILDASSSTQQTSQNITSGQQMGASIPYRWESPIPISCLLHFFLMFGSGSAGSDASPMVLVHPHLFPGHHTCSAIVPLQGEEAYFVRNKMAPDLSILALISRWSLISSLMVLSLLTSSHSSFSSASSLARVYRPRGVHLTSMPRETHEIPRHSLNGPSE